MIDGQRALFVSEIERYEKALKTTKSPYLKNDYLKKIRQMKRELKDYDRYHNGCRDSIT